MSISLRKKLNYLLCVIPLLLCFALLMPLTVNAEKQNSITLHCRHSSDAVENMRWRIYKVGERRNGNFCLTGPFMNYPINLVDMSADNISGAAKAMESLIIGSRMPCLAESRTDKNGSAVFRGLDAGLYFAVSKSVRDGAYTRRADPIFFEVTETNYESSIFPKVYSTATLADEIVHYTVKKIWIDSDNSYISRPVDITVDIYRDDELAETVILNESNNWTYEWTFKKQDAEWRVVERTIPRKYAVYVDYNSTQYLIKNAYSPDIIIDGGDYVVTTATGITPGTNDTNTTTTSSVITSSTTSSSSSSTSTETETAENNSQTASTSTTDVAEGTYTASETTASVTSSSVTTAVSDRPKLPQTGQLWWPVPLLCGGGITLIGAGVRIRKKDDEK